MNPSNPVDPELKRLLRQSVGRPADVTLQRDLWPQMAARMEAKPQRPPRPTFKLKWWEWALAGGDLAAAMYAPEALPALLYHL
jgi:hypothetical protein